MPVSPGCQEHSPQAASGKDGGGSHGWAWAGKPARKVCFGFLLLSKFCRLNPRWNHVDGITRQGPSSGPPYSLLPAHGWALLGQGPTSSPFGDLFAQKYC